MKTERSSTGLNIEWSQVREFHRLCGFPIGNAPQTLSPNRTGEWSRWLTEEVNEFSKATAIEDQADALMDLIYFALGAFVEMGIPPQGIFEVVHEANLAKLSPDGNVECTDDGKIVKPPNWIAPQHAIQMLVNKLTVQS
jgi:predicted HAD superfamily Cof-like phosphohydrolase